MPINFALFSQAQSPFSDKMEQVKLDGLPVAKHVKKYAKLGEGLSEIEKAILIEICADMQFY